ncbi:glycosyltransferase family 2 protein [Romeriopsis navalis]|uniref:glycosyltransferase family 2 protein n=1 Tax=Romeriopsis navalis TaxID=2992132 RepID=UPI0021F87D90|nr:glycosyltransferase family A protein [Romeriopsis navalis]
MTSELPLVSVIVPAYNAEDFIAETLDSVLQQTYGNLEVVVVDDGSDDRTAAIVAAIGDRDDRVRLISQGNAGVAAARNLGIAQSSGSLIAPLDADDLWHCSNLERQVACLLTHGESTGVVYTWSLDIDESNQLTGDFHASKAEGMIYKLLLCHNFLGNASASLIRRSCLEQVQGYSVALRAAGVQGCEDWDLYLRLAARYEFRVVPEFLVGYRKIVTSMSADLSQMAKSHDFMLRSLKPQSQLPAYIYRLSYSSFLMYLARQSDEQRQPRETIAWLRRTLKFDPLTPFLRLSFYWLWLHSLAQMLGARCQRTMGRRSAAIGRDAVTRQARGTTAQPQPEYWRQPPMKPQPQFQATGVALSPTTWRLRLTIVITHLLQRWL